MIAMSNAARILIALVIGLVLGTLTGPLVANSLVALVDLIGTWWLNGLRMTIVPLVVALLITGIARTAEAARAGRIAFLSIVGILIVTLASAVIGTLLAPAFLKLFPIPVASAEALKAALGGAPKVTVPPPFLESLRGLVPTNPIDSAARTDILPLLIFALVFAFAITRLQAQPRGELTRFFAALGDALVIIVEWVLKLAPIGVFALAYVVGARSGAAALGTLLHYVTIVGAVGLVVSVLAYPLAVIGGGVGLRAYTRAIAPVQALAVSTQSSLACLPIMLKKSEELGVTEPSAGVTLPLAVALLRATGPAMNLAVVYYVASWFGVEIGVTGALLGVFAAVLASLGAVSLPGTVSFFSSIVPISLALGVPVEPLALLIAVETLPDIVRTLGNVSMNVALTATVARRTGGIMANGEPQ